MRISIFVVTAYNLKYNIKYVRDFFFSGIASPVN